MKSSSRVNLHNSIDSWPLRRSRSVAYVRDHYCYHMIGRRHLCQRHFPNHHIHHHHHHRHRQYLSSRNRLPKSSLSVILTAVLASFTSITSESLTFGKNLPLVVSSNSFSSVSSSKSFSSSSSSSSSSSVMHAVPSPTTTTWQDDVFHRELSLSNCIVPLSTTSHKGSSGRVGVLGGSATYAGAPYYASMASLKTGADLVTCLTASEATTPIKCYSPELMVKSVYNANEFDNVVRSIYHHGDHSTHDNDRFYDDETVQRLVSDMVNEVMPMIERLHVLVIGPGLGRCPIVLEATSKIIQLARHPPYNLPLVLDADALFLLTRPRYRNVLVTDISSAAAPTTEESLDLSLPPPVVLTPNIMERKRLDASEVILPTDGSCTIIEKGATDEIKQPVAHETVTSTLATSQLEAAKADVDLNDTARHTFVVKMICGEQGGLKRSGGIGDILAGTCGTLLAWNSILTKRRKHSDSNKNREETDINSTNRNNDDDNVPLACWTACCFVKQATKRAFDLHRRSMTAPDILQELGPTIDKMTSEGD